MFNKELNLYIQLFTGMIFFLIALGIMVYLYAKVRERRRKADFKLPPIESTVEKIEKMEESKDSRKIFKVNEHNFKNKITSTSDNLEEVLEDAIEMSSKRAKRVKKRLPEDGLSNYNSDGTSIVKPFTLNRFSNILDEIKDEKIKEVKPISIEES